MYGYVDKREKNVAKVDRLYKDKALVIDFPGTLSARKVYSRLHLFDRIAWMSSKL